MTTRTPRVPAKRPDGAMSFGDHLEDLRTRIIWGVLGIVPIFVLSLVFGSDALGLIIQPLTAALRDAGEPTKLLSTNPIESFLAYLKVAMILTLLVGLPWVLVQAWLFISPGLHTNERKLVYLLIPGSSLLAGLSAVFLYKALLPISLYFMISFGQGLASNPPRELQTLTPEVLAELQRAKVPVLEGDVPKAQREPGMRYFISDRAELRLVDVDGRVRSLAMSTDALIRQEYRIGEYVGLFFSLSIVFAFAFQLPLVMLLVGWVGIIEYRDLTRYRRQIFFVCFVLGAVFTPQDPWSMIMLGGALYMLFELGLILMRVVPKQFDLTDGDAGDE